MGNILENRDSKKDKTGLHATPRVTLSERPLGLKNRRVSARASGSANRPLKK
jgi:hypothetical protein